MARSRRRVRGGLSLSDRTMVWGAKTYAKNVALPLTKYAVKTALNQSSVDPSVRRALELARSPEGQQALAAAKSAAMSPEARALAAQALLGAKAAYASPMGQAAKAQLMQAAQDATGVRIPMARTVAVPVPVAAPEVRVAAPVAAPSLSEDELALATIFLVGQRDSAFRDEVATRAVEQVAKAKNRDTSLALLDGITKLAEEVKSLHDAGTPMGSAARVSGSRNPGALAQMLPMLQDSGVRTRIAEYIVKAKEPAPGERKFLASSINQLVVAMRNRMQQKLMLGGRTRRGRKARRITRRC